MLAWFSGTTGAVVLAWLYAQFAKYTIMAWIRFANWLGYTPKVDLMAGVAIGCAVMIAFVAYWGFFQIGREIERQIWRGAQGW